MVRTDDKLLAHKFNLKSFICQSNVEKKQREFFKFALQMQNKHSLFQAVGKNVLSENHMHYGRDRI